MPVILGLLDLLPHYPQSLLQECGGHLTIRPLESHGINLDLACAPDDYFDGSVHLYPHEHEFNCAVLLLAAKNGQSPFSGFDRGFVDPVELEEFAVSLAGEEQHPAQEDR